SLVRPKGLFSSSLTGVVGTGSRSLRSGSPQIPLQDRFHRSAGSHFLARGPQHLPLVIVTDPRHHFRQTWAMPRGTPGFVTPPVQIHQHQVHHRIPPLDRLVTLQPKVTQAQLLLHVPVIDFLAPTMLIPTQDLLSVQSQIRTQEILRGANPWPSL